MDGSRVSSVSATTVRYPDRFDGLPFPSTWNRMRSPATGTSPSRCRRSPGSWSGTESASHDGWCLDPVSMPPPWVRRMVVESESSGHVVIDHQAVLQGKETPGRIPWHPEMADHAHLGIDAVRAPRAATGE